MDRFLCQAPENSLRPASQCRHAYQHRPGKQTDGGNGQTAFGHCFWCLASQMVANRRWHSVWTKSIPNAAPNLMWFGKGAAKIGIAQGGWTAWQSCVPAFISGGNLSIANTVGSPQIRLSAFLNCAMGDNKKLATIFDAAGALALKE